MGENVVPVGGWDQIVVSPKFLMVFIGNPRSETKRGGEVGSS